MKSLSPTHISWRLSWDAILFVVLWMAQFWSSEVAGMVLPSEENNVSLIVHLTRIFNYDPLPALLLIVLALYIGADLWLTERAQFRVKLAAIWISIFIFVVVPTIAAIAYRHNTHLFLYVHDGAIQTEEAITFLLAGKNPYVENYLATPMAQWPFHEPETSVNPALYHLPYLPLSVLLSVPFYWLSHMVLGWYDQRFVYLLLLLLGILMIARVGRTPSKQLAGVMLFALNPFFVPFFIEGRNDIVVSFWLVGALLLLKGGRIGWAGILIACAAVSKQTAWCLIPFFFFYALQIDRSLISWRQVKERAYVLVPALLVFVGVVLPFLIWDAGAFIDDVINFQFGTWVNATNYPIKSLGLGSLALGLGWIKHAAEPFPFSWFQILFGGLALLFLLYIQSRANTLTQMFTNYALLFFVVIFFSRTFNDNHLGFALTWLILPSFLDESADQTTVSPSLP